MEIYFFLKPVEILWKDMSADNLEEENLSFHLLLLLNKSFKICDHRGEVVLLD